MANKHRVIGWVVIIILVLVAIAAIKANIWLREQLSQPSPVGFKPQVVIIPPGKSLRRTATTLQGAGIIRDVNSFILLARVTRLDKKLQSGRYRFDEPMAPIAILKTLTKSGTLTEHVTIPEGYTLAEITTTLAEQESIDTKQFLSLAHDPTFLVAHGIEAQSAEGYLFPSTYNIYWKMDPKKALNLMTSEFHKVYNDSLKKRATALGLSTHQALTLASIIEREGKRDSERPTISSVFHNRLKKKMPLESCATVEFILPEHKGRLLFEDLKVQSPYNTYLHSGLPPGPICSPGRSSILAALYPADTDYLFFVSNGDGSHTFTRTGSQHAQAIQKIRGNHEK
jgi:UPF0755 protein